MKLFIYLLIGLIFFNSSLAHQIQININKEKAIVIKLSYPDGTPFSYEEFEIYSPKNNKIPFQVGRTDKLGRIIFIPNNIGNWRIKAFSRDGHGIDKTIFIEENFYVKSQSSSRFYFLKIFGAIIFIFLIFYILNNLARRKKIEE